MSYLPRLVVVDLKGSLGLLPEFGDLYEDVNYGGSSKAELAAAGNEKMVGRGLEGNSERPKSELARISDVRLMSHSQTLKNVQNPN